MIKNILVLLVALQLFVFADFQDINEKTLQTLRAKNVPVIDIRTPGEWAETGVIPGAHKIMFFDEKGNYDVNKFLTQLSKVVKDKDQPFVLVCRTASRTKIVGKFLANQVGYKHVKELGGGMMFGWKGKVEK